MSDVIITAGCAPAGQGTSLPTFSALVRAAQGHVPGLSQNKARRLTREYLRAAREPSLAQLLVHVEYTSGRPSHPDPTGETAVRNVMSRGGGQCA